MTESRGQVLTSALTTGVQNCVGRSHHMQGPCCCRTRPSRRMVVRGAACMLILFVLHLLRTEDDGSSLLWLLDGGIVTRLAQPTVVALWPAPARLTAAPGEWNPHRSHPRRCGQKPPPAPSKLKSYVEALWKAIPHEHPSAFPTFDSLWDEHVCEYDCLDRLRVELERAEITRWSASSGSSFGVRCSGSILPYDKDIDIVMSCADMDKLWKMAVPVRFCFTMLAACHQPQSSRRGRARCEFLD